jgi:4-amino-4-deoxy-L-arabinose transferase-like glycosyltransferase
VEYHGQVYEYEVIPAADPLVVWEFRLQPAGRTPASPYRELPVTAIPTRAGQTQSARTDAGRRIARLLRAHPADPAWARPALAGLLLATALLYLVGLDRNGWGNEFYAAAVQAGSKSWKAFLFGSLDSSNFITTDKPAGSLWVMELSARIFGVNYWSLLVPQALAGLATVGVLYTTVRRWFGPQAGLIAGAVTAVTPVAALMFRFDDPDAILTLTITLAGYAMTRAIESGRTRWVALAGVFVGAGFLSKFMAAFMVLPALALAYLWAGPPRLGQRVVQLLAGGGALLVTAGWWVALVLLTPAADRPFVGSSTDNNILNLILGYNGFGRLTGNESGGGFLGLGGSGTGSAGGGGTADAAGRAFAGGGSPFGGSGGITRLFSAQYGGQVAWLLPAALVAIVVMLWVSRRAARTDRTRAAALLWGGWLLAAGLVLSFMSGISHTYYVVVLTPAIGALVGIGAVKLWEVRRTWFARATLAVTMLGTGAWSWVLLGRSAGWYPWLRVVIVLAAVAAACLVLAGFAPRARLLTAIPVSLALVAGLGGPLAYSIETAATAHGGASPSAGPAVTSAFGGRAGGLGGALRDRFPGFEGGAPGDDPGRRTGIAGGAGPFGGNTSADAALVKLLQTGASGFKWAAATVGSDSAASMELGTGGDPVMAIGGFSGSDPTPTLAAFEQMVASHQVHYFVAGAGIGRLGGGALGDRLGAGGFSRSAPGGAGAVRGGGNSDSAQITSWVESHFTAEQVGGTTVYDLTAPSAGS